MRKKSESGTRQNVPDISVVSDRKKAGSSKKGVLGFLKK
jgi:hypothetical protein